MPELTSLSYLTRALRQSLESTSPLEVHQSTGSWLSSLIYMEAMTSAERLNKLAYQRLGLSAHQIDDANEISWQARQICASLQASVDQVTAFHRSCPYTRSSDYLDAHHFLERLHDNARALSRDIKESFDTQHQLKNIQVSTLAVNETRSAIARKSVEDIIIISLLTPWI